jgi:hypothetical protein
MQQGREVAASELLAEDEIRLLRRALLEWGGPARCSDQLAVGMGFAGAQDLFDFELDTSRFAVRPEGEAQVDVQEDAQADVQE